MNANNKPSVPVRARKWIDTTLPELETIQRQAEFHPVNAALHLAELSAEYRGKFGRDLIDDLEILFP